MGSAEFDKMFIRVKSMVISSVNHLPADALDEIKWKPCQQAEDDHETLDRFYAHMGHRENTLCICKATLDLSEENQAGIIAHEFGHFLAYKLEYPAHLHDKLGGSSLKGREGIEPMEWADDPVEIEADAIIEEHLGFPIEYDEDSVQMLSKESMKALDHFGG